MSGGGAGSNWTKLTQVATPHRTGTSNSGWSDLQARTSRGHRSLLETHRRDRVELAAQEFAGSGGTSTVWAKDVSASATNDAASSTITYPSLTPSSSGELYVGFSRASSASAPGTTPGFTYESPSANNLYVYDPSVSSSVSPAASQKAGRSLTAGALIEAS